MTASPTPAKYGEIARGLVVAAGLLAAAAVLRLVATDSAHADLARRWSGALPGFVVVLYANAIPKALVPLAQLGCDPAEDQAIRHAAGWSLALGGAGYIVAWLVAPLHIAALAAAASLALGLAVALGRVLRSAGR